MTSEMQAAVRGRWAVAAMFLSNGFLFGSWAPQIPLLLPVHQITESTLGLLILVLGLGAVAAMSFSGRLIARYGSRRMVRIFALLSSITLVSVIFAPTVPVLAVMMAMMGAFLGTMDVSMNANAVQVERKLNRAIMSSSHGFWSLGGFLGGGIGGYLISHVGREPHAVGASIIALLVMLAAMPFLVSDEKAPAVSVPHKNQSAGTRDVALYVLGLMALFSMVPEGGVLDWAALYLTKEHGSSLSTASFAFALFAGTMALVRFLGDSVRNRFGAVTTLRISGVVGAIGLMGASAAPSDLIAILCFGIAGLGVANMVPIVLSAAGNHPGASAGSGIATVSMMGYAGILFAPSAIGFAAEHIGYRMTYFVLAVLLAIVATLASRVASADRIGAHPHPAE
ncbi:MFS transporter [Tabrizicola sp. J26]|uniref:MFS transporter n=1 Tax=Alitabrizicola rongguiensis TaxID=2909234 RepID=UPI001F25527A|nr:MFS transporter [Tabrizicola rongguiensis]MCF1707372.1 MFS transporter [Tabrizicola rongguiensis]